MRRVIDFLPNLLTLANLLCGCLAVYFLLTFQSIDAIKYITVLIFLSLFFDFLDGLVARLLKVDGELGKQLDSLADMVSFGVLPGFLLLTKSFQDFSGFSETMHWSGFKAQVFPFALIIPLLAAYRLAKFNIANNQSENFRGLATPAYTLFVLGCIYFFFRLNHHEGLDLQTIPNYILFIVVLFGFLMVSNIPMFSFKFKNFTWKDNWFRYLLLIVSLGLLIWLKVAAFAIIIPFYVLLSLLARKSFV